MTTDWRLVRQLVNSALDACEALDQLQITDEERGVPLMVDGKPVASVWDALQSAHTAPENARYAIIRARGRLGDASPFVQPLSRVLQQVGGLAAELVGAQQLRTPLEGLDPYRPGEQSVAGTVENLAEWYGKYLVPRVQEAVIRKRGEGS